MMDKASHSFPRWVLVIVGLSALWALYGCGGGGGGGGAGAITAVPIGPGITSGIISGAVTASGTIASILPSAQAPGNATDPGAALRAATVPVVGARVWSESSPQVSTVSNTAGNYTLSDLPFGYHRIVAQRVDGFGSAYKVRSNSILVNSDVPIVNSVNLDLMPASNFVQGTLQNLDGQPIPNAVMTLWGETFTSDANGYFRSPPLPAVIYAEQIRMTPGGSYEPMTLTVPFTAMPQALNIIAARPGENRAPIVTVTAGKVMVTPHETPIVIIASATDRDNEPLTYNWSWTDGSLATSSPYTARWTAPGTSGLATVTVTVRDPRGATGRASIGFTVGGGTVATNRAPTATMQATTSVVINQSIDLRVTASDPDFDPLTYSWSSTPPVGAFSSLTASSTRWTAPGTAQTVVINCRVLDPKGAFTDVSQAVIVWDGVNPPPNQAPVVTMLPPVGESYGTGSMRLFAATSSILLSATALDPETGEIPTTDPAYYSQYQWFLLRGATRVQIGTGPAYYVSNLPPGTYTAIVRVYDRPPAPQQPMYAEAQVLLRINTPPTMTLAAAPVRTDYPLRQVITFTATVFDPDAEDNPIRPGNFRWRFDGIDAGVVGATIATTPTVPGSYVVDVTYTDHTPAGVQVSRRLRFDVATNTAPVVTITAISPTQTSYLRGTPISFSGTGADWEDDANFGPQNLSWLIEGRPAGQGGSITVATFSEGDNRVTLMGVDSLGAVGYATTSVTIEPNQVPQMQLVSVTPDQPTYPMGTSITFVAAGTDREDTAAFGPASFTWWLDLNLVGSGSANLTIASIPTGVHTITVRGTDQFGGVGAASRTITVQPNNSPAMQIVTPGTGGTYPYGTTLTFIGAGTDIEDGVRFTPASYVWFDNDVEFARGVANPARTFATAGAHVIRLEGTDSQFGVGTTSVSLTVLDNNRPVMQILAPPPSNRVFALQPQNVSEPIQFIGSGTDVEDGAAFGPANFIWYSFNHYQSANATNAFRLGIANPLRAAVVGTHTISLAGVDSWNLTGTTSIDIVVNASPTIQTFAPTRYGNQTVWSSGSLFLPGDDMMINVRAEDRVGYDEILGSTLLQPSPDNLILWYHRSTATPTWRQVASGSQFAIAAFQTSDYGHHELMCRATDAYGYYDQRDINYTVDNVPTGRIFQPTAQQYATAPNDIPVYLAGPNSLWLNFTCLATDVEDVFVPAASITWFITQPGVPELQIATGTLTYDLNIGETYPPGTTTFRISFYDSLGVTNTATLSFRVWKYDEFSENGTHRQTGFWIADPFKRMLPPIASASGIAVAGSDWYLSDAGNDCLWKFTITDLNPGGITLLAVQASTSASLTPLLPHPVDIAATANNAWTIDDSNQRAIGWAADLGDYASIRSINTLINVPGGLAATRDNVNVFLLDSSPAPNGKVVTYNGNSEVTGLSAPRGISAQGERVFVANTGANTIHRYDRTLSQTFISFGTPGTGPGQFDSPQALEFQNFGQEVLYVVDYNNKRIQAFDVHGNFLTMFGADGTGIGQFSKPHSIAVDDNHTILVLDHGPPYRLIRIRTGGGI